MTTATRAGSGLAATVLGAAVATRWFTERRGLVMGLLTASTNGLIGTHLIPAAFDCGIPEVRAAGLLAASHQAGAAFATYAAGLTRTGVGSYTPAFMAAGVLCIIAALIVLPIARVRVPGPATA